eukprot:38035-Eustigmatos_ZCMA.PRE.1
MWWSTAERPTSAREETDGVRSELTLGNPRRSSVISVMCVPVKRHNDSTQSSRSRTGIKPRVTHPKG